MSDNHELNLSKMQEDYHKGIEKITKTWMEKHKNTKTTVTTSLDKELEKWTHEYNKGIAKHT